MIIEPDLCIPKKGDILALCCVDYTGPVMYIGKGPGFGPHGGPVAIVQLIEKNDMPVVPVDSTRLVSLDCCQFGWSRA